MGLFDFLSKIAASSNSPSTAKTAPDKLTTVEKELIMVHRVSSNDMLQFTNMPYHLDCTVKKSIAPHSHPFAYIDLDSANIAVAKRELAAINVCLETVHTICSKVPANLTIPIPDIVFRSVKESGYTRLMCTPYTFTEKIAKYPLSLSFTTNLCSGNDSTHGELFYGVDGRVQKADIYFWRNGKGRFLHFKDCADELVLFKVETVGASGQMVTIYKRSK